MLTFDSIIAATRQESAFGEGRHVRVPRDRGARPRSAASTRSDESATPTVQADEKTNENGKKTMTNDVPLSNALLLWNSGINGGTPAFVVRPLGHDDYYEYDYSGGACHASWRKSTPTAMAARLMIDVWHITAFYGVPAELMKAELLRIPEYREMLADDCLPREFQHERAD